MKNVFLAVALSVLAVPAFAGDCPCKTATEEVVTKTVEVTTTVVSVPVNAVRSFRSRIAARRAARKAVREALSCSTSCGCSQE